jgi:hypothetical protein
VDCQTRDGSNTVNGTENVFAFELGHPDPATSGGARVQPQRRTKLVVGLLALVMVGLSAHWHFGPSGPELDPAPASGEDATEMTIVPATEPAFAAEEQAPAPMPNQPVTLPAIASGPGGVDAKVASAEAQPAPIAAVPATLDVGIVIAAEEKAGSSIPDFRRQRFAPLPGAEAEPIQPAVAVQPAPAPATPPGTAVELPNAEGPSLLPPVEADLSIDISLPEEGKSP